MPNGARRSAVARAQPVEGRGYGLGERNPDTLAGRSGNESIWEQIRGEQNHRQWLVWANQVGMKSTGY